MNLNKITGILNQIEAGGSGVLNYILKIFYFNDLENCKIFYNNGKIKNLKLSINDKKYKN